jgi:hypothetical protein
VAKGTALSVLSSSEEYLTLHTNGEASEPSSCMVSQSRKLYDVGSDYPESSDPTDTVDMVRRIDDDDGDVGVDTDDAADKSAAVSDEAVDVAVDEVAAIASPEVIGSGS